MSSPPPHASALNVSIPTAALHNLLRIAYPPVTGDEATIPRNPSAKLGHPAAAEE
jgi:hypothetical protein